MIWDRTMSRLRLGSVLPRLARSVLLALLCAGPAFAQAPPQLRLADDLDFSGEGYCVDVLGVGDTARADLPLVAHNCLPERNSSDRVVVKGGGRLRMPAFDACLTAFGVVIPLPGSPVILRPCGTRESFLPATNLQRFVREENGHLRLEGSNLCLTVGADVARTFLPTHRWRTLTVEDCATAPAARSVWVRSS